MTVRDFTRKWITIGRYERAIKAKASQQTCCGNPSFGVSRKSIDGWRRERKRKVDEKGNKARPLATREKGKKTDAKKLPRPAVPDRICSPPQATPSTRFARCNSWICKQKRGCRYVWSALVETRREKENGWGRRKIEGEKLVKEKKKQHNGRKKRRRRGKKEKGGHCGSGIQSEPSFSGKKGGGIAGACPSHLVRSFFGRVRTPSVRPSVVAVCCVSFVVQGTRSTPFSLLLFHYCKRRRRSSSSPPPSALLLSTQFFFVLLHPAPTLRFFFLFVKHFSNSTAAQPTRPTVVCQARSGEPNNFFLWYFDGGKNCWAKEEQSQCVVFCGAALIQSRVVPWVGAVCFRSLTGSWSCWARLIGYSTGSDLEASITRRKYYRPAVMTVVVLTIHRRPLSIERIASITSSTCTDSDSFCCQG